MTIIHARCSYCGAFASRELDVPYFICPRCDRTWTQPGAAVEPKAVVRLAAAGRR